MTIQPDALPGPMEAVIPWFRVLVDLRFSEVVALKIQEEAIGGM